jgi:hypothetical protein
MTASWQTLPSPPLACCGAPPAPNFDRAHPRLFDLFVFGIVLLAAIVFQLVKRRGAKP